MKMALFHCNSSLLLLVDLLRHGLELSIAQTTILIDIEPLDDLIDALPADFVSTDNKERMELLQSDIPVPILVNKSESGMNLIDLAPLVRLCHELAHPLELLVVDLPVPVDVEDVERGHELLLVVDKLVLDDGVVLVQLVGGDVPVAVLVEDEEPGELLVDLLLRGALGGGGHGDELVEVHLPVPVRVELLEEFPKFAGLEGAAAKTGPELLKVEETVPVEVGLLEILGALGDEF